MVSSKPMSQIRRWPYIVHSLYSVKCAGIDSALPPSDEHNREAKL